MVEYVTIAFVVFVITALLLLPPMLLSLLLLLLLLHIQAVFEMSLVISIVKLLTIESVSGNVITERKNEQANHQNEHYFLFAP